MPDDREVARGDRGISGCASSRTSVCDWKRRMARAKLSGCRHLPIATGLLAGARAVESPNCDARPGDARPELVVVHGISLPPGELRRALDRRSSSRTRCPRTRIPYFGTIQHLRVSSHALIAPRRRTHAVRAVSGARLACRDIALARAASGCNDFSIGIELEGTDDEPYDDPPVRGARGPDLGAAAGVSGAGGGLDRRPQRHRAGPQDRSGTGFDWPRLERDCALRGAAFRREVLA